jgi:DNA polymerase-3 subunit gamma/tau
MLTHCKPARFQKKKFLILAPFLKYVQTEIEQKIAQKPVKNPTENYAEVPKVLEKTSAPMGIQKKTSKFSITAALEKTDEQPEIFNAEAKKVLPSQHFSETDLQTEWQKFLEELQQRDIIIYNAISSFSFHKKSEDIVLITYPSESAKSEFEKIRTEFFNHFMRKVNHFNISIEYQLDVSMKKEIITKRKIFNKFAEINPVLKDLDDLFKLDFN